jgi:hypothetical protein
MSSLQHLIDSNRAWAAKVLLEVAHGALLA